MASSKPMGARYGQGDWFGVVRQGTVVLLGPEAPASLIDAVWNLLASAPEAHEVLHEVTDAFGVSLSRIPSFGIIDSKDGLRVFLRGDLELTVQPNGVQPNGVQSGRGEERVTGRDVTTWTERRLPAADAYSLRIGPRTTAAGSLPLLEGLPVLEGVVRVSALDVVLAAGETASAGAAGAGEAAISVPEDPRAAESGTGLRDHVDAQPPVSSNRVSDETVLGFPDADLGLTIAPHSLAFGPVVDALPEEGSPEPEPETEPEPAPEPETEPEPEAEVSEDSSDVPVHTSTTDPLLPTLETTTNYDHLWDKTVMRNIEDAAVRIVADADEHDVPAAPAPKPVDEAEPSPAEGEGAASGGSGVVPPPAAATAEAAPAPLGVPALIDSVPWLRGGAGAPAPQGGPEAAGIAGPPSAVPAGGVPLAQSFPDHDPDHDGQTVMKSSVAGELPTAASTSAQSSRPAGNGPSVLARVCSQGHANPPTYSQCAACGVALSGDAEQVPRPRLGRMRLSTGELIDLDQSLIIGRQPSVSRVQGGTMPRLVQVESPGGDISRSHVEVRLEGWHVMLCDLKATNGTVLIREGQAPRRLAQNEMAILLDGDIAELGDNISLRFEEIL
ncbi:MAG TPA: hypothetical protein VJP90_12495 [Paenarthrobacter sp.]|nr:hypothetical protein [Paenarthrobacter sp.]